MKHQQKSPDLQIIRQNTLLISLLIRMTFQFQIVMRTIDYSNIDVSQTIRVATEVERQPETIENARVRTPSNLTCVVEWEPPQNKNTSYIVSAN